MKKGADISIWANGFRNATMQYLMGKHSRYSSLKISLFICLTFFISFSVIAQEQLIKGNFSSFEVDPLGNIYTVTQDTLIKHAVTSKQKNYQYSNSRLGKITSFDATNPLKLLVLHGEFSTLVVLDVTLGESIQIYLPDLSIFSSEVAYAIGDDSTIWLYDDTEANLIRVNQNAEIVGTTQSYIQDVDFIPEISDLQFNSGYIILFDKNKGFIVCDQYGQFIKFIPETEITDFQLVEKAVFFKKNDEIIYYPLEVISKRKVATLPPEITKYQIKQKTLYFLDDVGVWTLNIGPES